MANEEHLAILRQGVSAWNRWRQAKLGVRPDLSGADLREATLRYAHLRGANLSKANLLKADLRQANLSEAILSEAILTEAILTEATLRYAILRGATLSKAKLSKANLSKANLSQANLTSANLSKADLNKATLWEADLRQADLSEANLSKADLSQAHLSKADLNKANVTSADLREATLRQADLRGATLWEADLRHANLNATTLNGATLSNVQIGWTMFGNVDLSEVYGLETIKHHGPSTIGIDTIMRSQGEIPEEFLRGAGVSDIFITYMQSLTSATIQYYSCFISYSSKDEALARRLYNDLQVQGVRCWFAPEDLKWSEEIRQGIDHAIRVHDKLLLILSEHSVESGWVQKEVETAFEQERIRRKQKSQRATVLFPVRIDNAVMNCEYAWAADIRRMRNIGDFIKWKDHDAYQKAFDRLLRDLRAETDKEDKSTTA